VGEHKSDDIPEPFADRVEARQDQVDARMIVFGEQDSAVDEQQLAVELDDGHIATNIPQTAQRDDAHCVGGQQGRDLQTTGGHVRKGYRPDTIAAVGAASGEPIAASVRLAWPAEAATIAELQRRSWATQWPAELAELMLSSVSLAEMVESWRMAIERPPEASFRVLVATDGKRIVGFATTMPNQDDDADRSTEGAIDQFVIDPPAQHQGHGSRLLNACADTLRADGFVRASCWVNAADDKLLRFLTGAGWAADGASREIGTEDESVRLKQVRLHTVLEAA
jgi:ribosomal protein S18 acetylase RimI-like enzyme